MAATRFRGSVSGEYCGNMKLERTLSGRRRVFVQTETGSVVGLELDRRDNIHTVKKTLQLALNVPTEERSLICGDMVLKNDLSAVRHDSPLLLTRNFIHRSSSTPCLSPTGKDLQPRDLSGPVEVLGCSNRFSQTKYLVKEIVKAMELGIDPIPVCGGLGGAYYFRDCNGENCAIVKPTDEEPYAPNNPKGFVGKSLGQPGLKRSVRVGETGFREVVAYLLDHDHFANVPPTALVKVTHPIFNLNEGVNRNKPLKGDTVSKIASLQQFIPHDFDASDYGTSSFPVAAVHRIGILDVRILNTDRHAGNLLVRKLDKVLGFGRVELLPIDHGLCLPENLEDPYFEWIHWPQSSIPFSEDELDYISSLDPFRESEMLKMELPMIRQACLRVLVLCTSFLKQAAAFGLCLADIGEMMSREFRGGKEDPSELEHICIKTRRLLDEKQEVHIGSLAEDSRGPQFCILNAKEELVSRTQDIESNARNSSDSFLELDEKPPKFEVSGAGNLATSDLPQVETPLKLSTSTRSTSDGEGDWRRAARSTGNGSLNNQPTASTSFVKLADMIEEDWLHYLEIFHKLLIPSLSDRKSTTMGQKQMHKLGTSFLF